MDSQQQKTQKTSQNSKARLRELREELIRLKAAGQDNTAAFRALEKEAGDLQDAISDVSAAVKRVGSDTRVFEGLIDIAGGVTAGLLSRKVQRRYLVMRMKNYSKRF